MKRAIFIGQAMPRFKKDLHDWPSLNSWLFSVGVTMKQIRENFFYSALVDYFPGSKNGSHRVPTRSEIEKEWKRLEKTLKDFDPEVIIPIGRLSISYCLCCEIPNLVDVVGKIYKADPYGLFGQKLPIIPLPHPSGASIWRYKDENQKLLQKALMRLKTIL